MKSMWGRVFVMMLGVVTLTISSSQAAGLATPGVGVRARSMGGAFRGLANDWSAASYNPAGLAFMKSSELNISLGTYTPGLSYTPNLTANDYDMGFKDGQKRYPLDELFPIPSFAGVAVPSEAKGWVLGAAIFWPYDVNYSWDLFSAPLGYNNDFQFAKKNFRTDLNVLDIHPVVARKINENLSVGAGLSLTAGDLVYRRVLFIKNPLGTSYDYYPYDRFLGDFELNGNGFAVGGNAGILWRISENLSLGVSGQTPITIPLKGTSHLAMAWPKNTALANPPRQVVVGSDTLTSDNFFSGNYREGFSRQSEDRRPFNLDLQLPAQFGAGVAWMPSDRLTLAFDVAATFWSAVDRWDIALENGGLNTRVGMLESVQIPFGWKDQIRISGGAEFAARENLMLRCGLYYDGSAAPDSTFGPSFPDVGSRIGLTFGGSYTVVGHLELSAAQELGFYSKRNVGNTGTGVGQTVYPGEYSALRSETLLSMSYWF
jgi:long-chain fatty acid transport protein